MSDQFDSEDYEEKENFDDLDAENEFKKMKLALEHGMDLSKPLADSELPPEIEGQFLDYVQQWEDEMAKGKMILVYDLVGRPEWRPVAEIDDDEIGAELEKILELLHLNSLHLDTICPVDDRELYRFITEELFIKETNDIRIPGMMHCYIYEEYHPNHDHDIKNRCQELVDHIFNKENDQGHVPWSLADNVVCSGIELTKEALNKKLMLFRDAFSSFEVHEIDFTTILRNAEDAVADVMGYIRYTSVIDGSPESIDFEGECRFSLCRSDDWWEVDSFEIPGLTVA